MCSSSKAGSDTLHSDKSLPWRDLRLTELRHIDSSSSLTRYRCLTPADETLDVPHLYSLRFDLRILYRNLLRARNDALLRLSGDATSGHIDFALHHFRTLQAFRIHNPLLSRSSQMMHLPQIQNQYQITVGIPAGQFREIVMTLSRVGVTVSASVTDTQVQFSVVKGNGNGGIISSRILKKPEQCIIKGDVGPDPVFLVLDLCHAGSIVNASVMSNMVWLLGQSNGSSVKLDCPFGKLGNLYYHFHEA